MVGVFPCLHQETVQKYVSNISQLINCQNTQWKTHTKKQGHWTKVYIAISEENGCIKEQNIHNTRHNKWDYSMSVSACSLYILHDYICYNKNKRDWAAALLSFSHGKDVNKTQKWWSRVVTVWFSGEGHVQRQQGWNTGGCNNSIRKTETETKPLFIVVVPPSHITDGMTSK